MTARTITSIDLFLVVVCLSCLGCFAINPIMDSKVIPAHKPTVHDEVDIEYPENEGLTPNKNNRNDTYYIEVSLTFVNPDPDQVEYYYAKFQDQLDYYHAATNSMLEARWDNWYYTVQDSINPYINDFISFSTDAGAYAETVGSEDSENKISIIVIRDNPQEKYGINGFVKAISQYDIKQDVLCTLGHADYNYYYTKYDYNYVFLSYTGLTTAPTTLAHELGHFFMLPHDTTADSNVMWPFSIRTKRQTFRQTQLDTIWNALPYRDCVIKSD